MRQMKILFATSEAAPFAKTGGLGDVAGALPAALAGSSYGVRVIMPLYGSIPDQWRAQMKFIKYIYVPLAWRNLYCGLFELKKDGVTFYFVDNEYYFKRAEIYGHYDDGERYAFFSRAVAALLTEFDGWAPDVVHCNDWQTALIPTYMRRLYDGVPAVDAIRTVFTIHNIAYQGRFGRETLENVFGLPHTVFDGGTLEYMGGLNLMKGAIELSDRVTTVSPSYAEELQYAYYAHGLEGVLAANRDKLTGILNGIDTALFDPATDGNLTQTFTADSLKGKAVCKAELQKLLGLTRNPDVPLVVSVGRLVSHKGMDLVAEALDELMDMDIQFALLGRGDWHFEQFFSTARHNYEGRLSASILYNASLSGSLYAGGDMFLMPSQSEPCGLSQMIAMRYGTVPVVRETGGLKDTVEPYNSETDEGLGFTFANYDKYDLLYAVRRAVDLYHNHKNRWAALMKRGMSSDFSWTESARMYKKLYKEICK
ncbi:MAG: glycogen synthase GlgA [Oscillospiraceae bacterium]|jgi:starch synthase|nr:glycogen synthase GlgA [Oscillospiraceae bacterium]